MIQLGQYQTTDKEYKFIQSPGSAAQHLKATAQTIHKKRNQNGSQTSFGFSLQEDFQVTPSDQGGILEVELKEPNATKAQAFFLPCVSAPLRERFFSSGAGEGLFVEDIKAKLGVVGQTPKPKTEPTHNLSLC